MYEIKAGVVTGVVLIGLGLVGYVGSGMQSVTALIPAFFGIPILLASLLATKKLKLGMHIAATFGLLGAIAPLGRIIPKTMKGEFELTLASSSMILMALTCLVFVVVCIKSFRDARKNRES